MHCRQPSLDGTGAIELRRLVKEALRMRPGDGQIPSKAPRHRGGQPIHESHADGIAGTHPASRVEVCQRLGLPKWVAASGAVSRPHRIAIRFNREQP